MLHFFLAFAYIKVTIVGGTYKQQVGVVKRKGARNKWIVELCLQLKHTKKLWYKLTNVKTLVAHLFFILLFFAMELEYAGDGQICARAASSNC